jgi:hypothetical protein
MLERSYLPQFLKLSKNARVWIRGVCAWIESTCLWTGVLLVFFGFGRAIYDALSWLKTTHTTGYTNGLLLFDLGVTQQQTGSNVFQGLTRWAGLEKIVHVLLNWPVWTGLIAMGVLMFSVSNAINRKLAETEQHSGTEPSCSQSLEIAASRRVNWQEIGYRLARLLKCCLRMIPGMKRVKTGIRTATIWITGLSASAILGGLIAERYFSFGFDENGGWGVLAGVSAFTCARLWISSRRASTQ